MSDIAMSRGQDDVLAERLAALPRQPAEGWLTLVATAMLAVAYAMAVHDSGWIPGAQGDTGYLPALALLGIAVGFGGAKAGWGRWRTHLAGATLGGLLLPLVMGGAVIGSPDLGLDPHSLGQRLAASTHIASLVWRDLVIEGRPFTTQYAHFHLVFGAMVWGVGQFAGFTVFGHRRPLDAVVVVGLLLLANMVLTVREQLPLLIMFTAAALLLLIRSHVFEEQVAWTRRRIGDPGAVSQLYMRGGALFVALAVAGSLALTAAASSAPLQDLWKDVPARLMAMSEWLQRIAPPGSFRSPGAISFGPNVTTTGVWRPSDRVAFRAQFGPSEPRVSKWRVRTYADYQLYGWDSGETREEPTPAGEPILGRQPRGDRPTQLGRRELRAQVTVEGLSGIASPQALYSVDVPTTAVMLGEAGWFATVTPLDSPQAYSLVALVPVFGDVPGGITEARLRAAGTDYPDEMVELYTALPDGALGEAALDLFATIREGVDPPPGVDPDNAYDLARAIESHLRDEQNFGYDDNVVDLMAGTCDGVSSVECFARITRGHCQHYASTMAVLLRHAGIPARIATGFLPGERDETGLEVVGGWAAHWWVEVYFPGTGWVEFDPTGGNVGEPQAIPSGSASTETAPPSRPPATVRPIPTTPTAGGSIDGSSGGGANAGPFIAITVILGVGFAALAMAALRRRPRNPMHPDLAWGGLGRWAARLGLGPRPSQTVYEYAGALGDELPGARVELTTLARAKVEVAYGRRDIGADRLRSIAEAYQRLRFALVSFAIRRRLRRRRRE